MGAEVVDADELDQLFAQYDETMDVDQVAQILTVSKRSVYNLLTTADADARIPGYKVGKVWMIVRDEFKTWLRAHRNE